LHQGNKPIISFAQDQTHSLSYLKNRSEEAVTMFKNRWFVVMLVFAILFGVSGCSGEQVLATDDPVTQANDGHPVFVQSPFVPPAGCDQTPEEIWENGELTEETVTWCKPGYSGKVDVVDMAMLATIATPWPGDEEIVGLIWVGKTITKIVLVAESAYLAANAGIQVAQMGHTRHGNPAHDPRLSQIARDLLEDVHGKISQKLSDPNNKVGPLIYCAVVAYQNSTIVRVLVSNDGVNGTMAWYGNNGWVGAFDGKTVDSFINGMPRGALSVDTGHPLQDCLTALGGTMPGATQYKP
jgi:hypothetical protein